MLNKIDLLNEESAAAMRQRLTIYEKIGYRVLWSSAYTHAGFVALDDFLKDKIGVLVGPSGVGKSSIIAGLNDQAILRIGENTSNGLGKIPPLPLVYIIYRTVVI